MMSKKGNQIQELIHPVNIFDAPRRIDWSLELP